MEKKKHDEYTPTPSADEVQGPPRTVWEQTNKYGTYNIQPTQDSENEFPKIEQH